MGLRLDDPLQFLWAVVTMRQTYYLVDIPLLYARLMLVAPLGLVLLVKGRTWLLLAISLAIWIANLSSVNGVALGWRVANNRVFHLAAWQLMFFAGMATGHHRRRLARVIRANVYPHWIGASGFGCVILLLVFFVAVRGTYSDLAHWLFEKPDIGPGRLMASAVVFTFAFLSVHSLWVPLRRALGWLLLPLGQHALFAYASHVLLGMALVSVEVQAGYVVTDSRVANVILQLGAIGIVWLAIRYRALLPGVSVRPMPALLRMSLFSRKSPPSPLRRALAPLPAYVIRRP